MGSFPIGYLALFGVRRLVGALLRFCSIHYRQEMIQSADKAAHS